MSVSTKVPNIPVFTVAVDMTNAGRPQWLAYKNDALWGTFTNNTDTVAAIYADLQIGYAFYGIKFSWCMNAHNPTYMDIIVQPNTPGHELVVYTGTINGTQIFLRQHLQDHLHNRPKQPVVKDDQYWAARPTYGGF